MTKIQIRDQVTNISIGFGQQLFVKIGIGPKNLCNPNIFIVVNVFYP